MKPSGTYAYSFPPVTHANDDGLLAVGGDLRPERLIAAYESGIFPWYNEGQPILWWAPPERMILFPYNFRLTKSLAQSIRNRGYQTSFDTAFEQVIEHCQKTERPGQNGTWITQEMKNAYIELHRFGYAHSVEVWQGPQLVGGLYGVSLGKAFFGESMFSLERDASKVALHALNERITRLDFHFIDCQLHTDHLASLGAQLIPRDEFMELLKLALDHPDHRGNWRTI
ncbi:MAG: leucyl/phenylalanyl-tRNA--protein transferase [Salibacteraceae bacterium]